MKMKIEKARAYKVNEAAEVLNLHPATLRRLLTEESPYAITFRRQLHPVKIGKQWRIFGNNLYFMLGGRE